MSERRPKIVSISLRDALVLEKTVNLVCQNCYRSFSSVVPSGLAVSTANSNGCQNRVNAYWFAKSE
jgi:hypothetical protein